MNPSIYLRFISNTFPLDKVLTNRCPLIHDFLHLFYRASIPKIWLDVATETNINSLWAAAPSSDIKVPIIWVLGGPGSGKGTQCEKIVAKYGFTHLSSGDLLRNEVKSGSPRGKELNEIMEKGELVPLDVVLDLIKEEMIKEISNSKGYLIDGYPREKEQGIAFEKKIGAVSVVLFFDAPDNVLVDRLLGRAKTSGRVDDNEETIKKRLNTFHTHNDQVVQQYTEKLKKINAEREPDVIFTEVQTYLDPLVKC